MPSTEYLDEERKKLWKEVIDLKAAVENKTSDYEKSAQQSSKKTSEFRNRSQESKELIDKLLAESQKNLSEINVVNDEVKKHLEVISQVALESEDNATSIDDIKTKGLELKELFEEYETFEENLRSFNELFDQGYTLSTKITAIYNLVAKRNKEIHQTYYEIIGYEETDEGLGDEIHVD